MGDDEINQLLARGEHELPIFEAMDIQREKDAKAQWKAQGGSGPPPERLIQDDEVPEVYKRDVVIVSTEKEEDEGRGQRVKAAVVYDDGLTEEQFLNVSPARTCGRGDGGRGTSQLTLSLCRLSCSNSRTTRTRTTRRWPRGSVNAPHVKPTSLRSSRLTRRPRSATTIRKATTPTRRRGRPS